MSGRGWLQGVLLAMQITGGEQVQRYPHPLTASALVLCNAEKLFTKNGASGTVSKKSEPWMGAGIQK